MIPVVPQPQPPDFEGKVGAHGREFLRRFGNPSREQFKKNSYWQQCLPDLRKAYGEICAYSACWVHFEGTVDHFWPLSARPDLAYEWGNYRLAFSKLNSYKRDRTDILDPFHIRQGWFVLNFTNFYVEPGAGLPPEVTIAVKRTIEALRLNLDDALVKLRFTIVRDYAQGDLTLAFLVRRYPFIGIELQRQNLTQQIKTYFP